MALTRSQQMARIRGANTEPEVLLQRALKSGTTGVRLGRIRPDLVFARRRVALFVDGCFWHGCPHHYVRPKGNADFWSKKLTENTSRDSRQTKTLMDDGWKVIRFWEHEVRTDLDAVVSRVRRALATSRSAAERWRVVLVQDATDGRELRTERKLVRFDEWRQTISKRTTAKEGAVVRQVVRSGIGGGPDNDVGALSRSS
ncbi:MAG: very short patch repair endonuclease [Myxococcaceae bacterium]